MNERTTAEILSLIITEEMQRFGDFVETSDGLVIRTAANLLQYLRDQASRTPEPSE